MWGNKIKNEIQSEVRSVAESLKQMTKGNLDISLSSENYSLLFELVPEINCINNIIEQYVKEITHILSHLSVGDMTVSFTENATFMGDFYPIKNALERIKHSLRISFTNIQKCSMEIEKVSCQIESSASRLAGNANEQSIFIEELRLDLNRIFERTKVNSDNALLASRRITEIVEESEEARLHMNKAIEHIVQLKDSSQSVSEIIDVIDDVARKTKLLALNASIEAARAGSEGRGFTVVALEIGRLAAQSSEAVKQTTDLITAGVEIAKNCSDAVHGSIQTFGLVLNAVAEIKELCDMITSYSEDQTGKIKNTYEIVSRICEALNENKAFADEYRSMALDLRGMSVSFSNELKRYRLSKPKVESEQYLKLKEMINGQRLLGMLVEELKVINDEPEHAEGIMKKFIADCSKIECFYIIDSSGYQFGGTIMNPTAAQISFANFMPAISGDFHGQKKYFRQAMKNKHQCQISDKYISAATGGLCITISQYYESSSSTGYVACMDMMIDLTD